MPVIFRKLTRKFVNVLRKSHAQVNTAQKTLAHHVAVLISEFSKTAKICGKDELATELLRRLTDAGLLPAKFDSPEHSIKTLAQKLEDIEMPALLSDTEICACPDFTFDRNLAMVPPIETARASDGTKHLRSCYRLKLENAQVVLVTQRHALFAARNVREICVGLCLDCVKRPGSQHRAACRVAHPQPWVQHARDDRDSARELDLDVFRVDRGPRGLPSDTGIGVVDRDRFYMGLLQNYPRPAFWKDTW
ncbi:hypothetical protein M409DRAFT_24050 [Zasmidium cellare ATCC 36951]|uniref:Uncharacterized protein n=1 Tax=Zasmidium cellare ATCC 36951 TaxID=1080233 RepID=A0A6A6CEW9_ZASCE|nr:uncharacterized protein M409DRAFT_24050 [Zasmidium cellare ATCC 36951]KAF2165764.1 hypothetical protein M409DRAFT_24050 [Zasmidium cellare ATCC 36951]